MRHEIPSRGGDERGVFSTLFRRRYGCTAPVKQFAKRKFNRRARRLARQWAKKENPDA